MRAGDVTESEPPHIPGQVLGEVANRRLKVVRENYVAFNNGDIDGVMRPMHPDVEMIVADENGRVDESQHHRGRAEVRAFFEEVQHSVSLTWVEIRELTPSEECIVALVWIHGRVDAMGAEGKIPAVHRYTFDVDEISRIETFRPDWRRETV